MMVFNRSREYIVIQQHEIGKIMTGLELRITKFQIIYFQNNNIYKIEFLEIQFILEYLHRTLNNIKRWKDEQVVLARAHQQRRRLRRIASQS